MGLMHWLVLAMVATLVFGTGRLRATMAAATREMVDRRRTQSDSETTARPRPGDRA